MTATASDMVRALYCHFSDRWAVVTEIEAANRSGLRLGRRIDMLLLRRHPRSDGVERLAIEIKVDRRDFYRDVRNPAKQDPWRKLAHRHAYAVPEGLVTPDEVPEGSGLIVVGQPQPGMLWPSVGFPRRAVRPPGHDPGPLPGALQMDAWWRASRLQARDKGYGVGNTPDDPAELQARLLRAERQLELARDAELRERERRLVWQRRYAAHEPPECGTCGHPLYPVKTWRDDGWEHRDQPVAGACEADRRAVAEAENAALPEDEQYRRVPVPGPEPVYPVAVV